MNRLLKSPPVIHMKKRFLICSLILLLLLLPSCGEAGQESTAAVPDALQRSEETDTETADAPDAAPAVPVPEEAENAPSEDAADPQAIYAASLLEESSLEEYDPGLVYRYNGDGCVFQPAGWNITLTIPEDWKDRVEIFCSHPVRDELSISITSKEVIQLYMSEQGREASCSYYDYLVSLIVRPCDSYMKDLLELEEKGCGIFLEGDETYVYFLQTSLSRDPECQEEAIRQTLVDIIGESAYAQAVEGLTCSLEDAQQMFSIQ